MTLAIAFLRPELWPLLLLGPGMALALWALARRRDRCLERALGARYESSTHERLPRTPRRVLLAVALLLLAVAAMGPAGGPATTGVGWQGADILVALDVSRSMLARDVAPDRLTRAKQEIRALTEKAEGDRFGLVAFAGDADLRVPLTRDTRSFVALTDEATPDLMTVGGTDLGRAIDRAREALARRKGAGVIVLLTDGEDLSERGLDAAARCRAEGIVVHAVGLGTTRGSKIHVDLEGASLLVRDPHGDAVVSALDEASLRAITAATEGAYVAASERADALASLYEDAILPAARRTLQAAEDGRREDHYALPLLAAFLLLLLETAWPRRRVSGVRRLRRSLAVPVSLALLLVTGCDRTNEGRGHWDEGRVEDARASFARAAETAGERASPELLYDLALTSLHTGDLDAAWKTARRLAKDPDGRLKAEGAFVRGNVAFERSKQRAEEAKKTPSDLRALLPAIRDGEDALAAWQWAAASRPDWPEARRNAARARIWLESLRETRGDRQEQPKPLPQPGPGEEEPPEDPSDVPPPLPPPPMPEPESDPEAPQTKPVADLPPGKVLGLFDVLREKEKEKRVLRRVHRQTRTSEGSKDW